MKLCHIGACWTQIRTKQYSTKYYSCMQKCKFIREIKRWYCLRCSIVAFSSAAAPWSTHPSTGIIYIHHYSNQNHIKTNFRYLQATIRKEVSWETSVMAPILNSTPYLVGTPLLCKSSFTTTSLSCVIL